MRKLAHVEKVLEILPIEGADNIELAKILGWQCVVKKGEVKVGEMVVYHEIDCVCPERPEYEFLKPRKMRIRTIKLRGCLSQGLILPLSILPKGKYSEGDDVTEVLGLKHYDPESPLSTSHVFKEKTLMDKVIKFLCNYSIPRKLIMPFLRKEKGNWPQFIAKTDEDRIQGAPGLLVKLAGVSLVNCEKLDGQSFTGFFRKERVNLLKSAMFGVCSRNIWLKTQDDSVHWKMARKYNLEKILTDHFNATGEELVIQGEQVGPGIQKNKYQLKEHELYVFNIINSRTNYHYNHLEMDAFCQKHGLKMVPVLDANFVLPSTVDELLALADGKSVLNKNTNREGLVIRLIKDGQKVVSFKAISNKFLLGEKDD